MSKKNMRIVIPMAGFGTRLRPHTWSKPKQLIRVANNTVLGHILDAFANIPKLQKATYVFIIGYLGDRMRTYMRENYPNLKVHYVVQDEMKGQSHAVYQARDYLDGPILMVFADTLVEMDFTFLDNEAADGVVSVKRVSDPRSFGVAIVGNDGYVTQLIEKPDSMENNLAVVGFYYFADSRKLVSAIEKQMRQDLQLNGEYFLVDAINIMIENGLKLVTKEVGAWVDAGTPEDLLRANRYLLDHGRDNTSQVAQRVRGTIVPPVYVHPSAEVIDSVIGPYVSVGPDSRIRMSVVRNSILDSDVSVTNLVLTNSLLGQGAQVRGRAKTMNVGDDGCVE